MKYLKRIRSGITTVIFIFSFIACNSEPSITEGNQRSESDKEAKAIQLPYTYTPFEMEYFGQQKPGDIPVIFSPGLVSTDKDIYGFEISPSGKEMIYTRPDGIYIIEYKSGDWLEPRIISFGKKYNNGEACFSRDGTKIYFNSRRPCPASTVPNNLWISEKKNGLWGEPVYSGLSKVGKTVHSVSVAANGNLYSDGITRFINNNGTYSKAEILKPHIKGGHVFIASDESYLMFDQRVQGNSSDIFIIFMKSDGTWTSPVPLDNLNTSSKENQPSVSSDGKYLFFTRSNKIHWVKADFIEEMKLKYLNQ